MLESMTRRRALECAGIAARSDLDTPEWQALIQEMRTAQDVFLAHEAQFRSPEYAWPRDALHNWSRIWEYPWAYHHLRRWLGTLPVTSATPHVVDIGSGVTFFPFAVAALGCEVTCTDMDSLCATDIPRAAAVVPHSPGRVAFRPTDGARLPFDDGEVDAVYCISVLEHVPRFDQTIREMHRVLRPGGFLLLTIDLDLAGNAEIGPPRHGQLLSQLEELFEPMAPIRATHPADMLTTERSPLPLVPLTRPQRVWFHARQWLIKPLLLRRPHRLPNLHLAVEGLTMRRPEAR